jgi:hypothetical protein
MILFALLVFMFFIGLQQMERPEPIHRTPESTAPVGDYTAEMIAADTWLRNNLRDYGSARLHWDTKLSTVGTITVYVNARNGFGGYTGEQQFTFYHGIRVKS